MFGRNQFAFLPMLSHVVGKIYILHVDRGPQTVTFLFIIDFMEEFVSTTIYPFNTSLHKVMKVCSNACQVHAYLRRGVSFGPKVHQFLVNLIKQLRHVFSNFG